jgi:hypothetical protein
MRLGLLADIHEDVGHLRHALARFRRERVDQIVVLGDVVLTSRRLHETCSLLAEANVIGVWGNHDYGLSYQPSDALRQQYQGPVIDVMSAFQPRIQLDGCLFTHVEPWLDPTVLQDLWYYEGEPDTPEKVKRIFDCNSCATMFAGHLHHWLAVTPDGITAWDGRDPICLGGQRYYVIVGAVCQGRYAIFDTQSRDLVPFNEEPDAHGHS